MKNITQIMETIDEALTRADELEKIGEYADSEQLRNLVYAEIEAQKVLNNQ